MGGLNGMCLVPGEVVSFVADRVKESKKIEEFIKGSSKAESHLHTSGSIGPEFFIKWGKDIDWEDPNYPKTKELLEIEREYNVKIADVIRNGDIGKLKEMLESKGGKEGLLGYLKGMNLGHRLLHGRKEVWEDLAYDIARRSYGESKVRYLELRFPVVKPPLKPEEIIAAIHNGLIRAEKDYKGLKTAMIVCVMKTFTPEQTGQVVKTVLEMKNRQGYQGHLIGLDTAGPEYFTDPSGKTVKFEPRSFGPVFREARNNGMLIVNHAGEQFRSLEDGLLAIKDSVVILGAKRIGHALALGVDPGSLLRKTDKYGKVYDLARVQMLKEEQRKLVSFLINNKVVIESCLSSNLQTSPELIPTIKDHPLKKWIKAGLRVTLSTDNLTTSHTTLTSEYLKAARAFGLSQEEIGGMIKNGVGH